MVVNEGIIYIFGGKSDFKATSTLWKFTLGINVYELLAADHW